MVRGRQQTSVLLNPRFMSRLIRETAQSTVRLRGSPPSQSSVAHRRGIPSTPAPSCLHAREGRMSNVKQRVLHHHAMVKAAWLHQIGLMERGELSMMRAGADQKMVDCTAE